MKPLVIVGAGGHGRETLDVVEAINDHGDAAVWQVVGFVADWHNPELVARRSVPVLGDVDVLTGIEADYVIGIGSGEIRRALDGRIDRPERAAEALVHPRASLGSDLRLGPGVILAAGARVTTNVTLGRHTHLNVNAVVSHDCELGDYVTCSPGVLVNGSCRIEDGVFLGTGAVVTPGRHLGAGAIIGAGAVVVDDIPARVTARGVPARW